MLNAFDSPTGIPYYWFNLKTGETKGERVNVAEAGTYLIEMGILSYYTQNPVYYQAAKRANLAIWDRVSDIHLVGEYINVETGEWTKKSSHICAGIDSYYEYLLKAYILFNDESLLSIWQKSIHAVHTYLAEESDTSLWYRRVDMHTGEKLNNPVSETNPDILEGHLVTLYDGFFPAVLVLNNDIERAAKFQGTFNWLWNRYGLIPTVFDFNLSLATYPVYDLNPEIIESAYYLYNVTGKSQYMDMISKYWDDLLRNCKTETAFASVQDVHTMEKKDYMPTYFLAETLKYFYLAFNHSTGNFNPDDYIFNTEAHPFLRESFKSEKIKSGLGI
jgi:mannosidase alpha-like ER degradation enhancer 1/mannosidase alpha-like ER degradation enhancer 2